jgi:3-polyprenyl-4-hydroxybenzoate decarboxylase
MGIDATAKDARDGFERPWPQEVITSPDVAARVLERWREYGFS